jgi:hypothetical protein
MLPSALPSRRRSPRTAKISVAFNSEFGIRFTSEAARLDLCGPAPRRVHCPLPCHGGLGSAKYRLRALMKCAEVRSHPHSALEPPSLPLASKSAGLVDKIPHLAHGRREG